MTIQLTRRQIVTSGVACAAAAAVPRFAFAQGAKSEYKLSVTGARQAIYVEAAYKIAEIVAQKTSGRINIKVYPGSQLVSGDATREFPALRRGVADFVVSSTINLAPHIKEMGLFSLPFLMPDSRGWDAIFASDVRKDLEGLLAARDAVTLGWCENGFRQICNAQHEVRKPADLKGLKIRYAANPLYADIFNALGANPVQMSWGDLQAALATGAVDGLETPVNVFKDAKLYTLKQRHMSLWNYSTDAMAFLVNSSVFNTFSAADRDVLHSVTEEVAKTATADSRVGIGGPGGRATLDELAKHGVAIAELTDAEKAEFKKATAAVMTKWAPQVGDAIVAKAMRAVSKAA